LIWAGSHTAHLMYLTSDEYQRQVSARADVHRGALERRESVESRHEREFSEWLLSAIASR